MEEIFRVEIDMECPTFGDKDDRKRLEIREKIREKYNAFGENSMQRLINEYESLKVLLNCYFENEEKCKSKDIDNLAKIPLDAVFFSGAYEIGAKQKWESKITALEINKLRNDKSGIEIIIFGLK